MSSVCKRRDSYWSFVVVGHHHNTLNTCRGSSTFQSCSLLPSAKLLWKHQESRGRWYIFWVQRKRLNSCQNMDTWSQHFNLLSGMRIFRYKPEFRFFFVPHSADFQVFLDIFVHFYAFSEFFLKIHSHACTVYVPVFSVSGNKQCLVRHWDDKTLYLKKGNVQESMKTLRAYFVFLCYKVQLWGISRFIFANWHGRFC